MSNQDTKVADYSFLDVTNVKDILDLQEEDVKRNTNQTERQILDINTINFSSNKIVQISDLPATLATMKLSPQNIKWIDFSNNKISSLGDAFDNFDNLTVLYLHANNFSSIRAIKPLEKLEKLNSLTLHGNPIEAQKHFRNYIIYLLPNLEKLNFSLITNRDKDKCKTWSSLYHKKLSGATNDQSNG